FLSRLLLRRRTSPHPAFKKRRVLSHEIERREGRGAHEDRQVHPCLPVVNGPCGDEQQKTHHDGEDSECEPCPCSNALHGTLRPSRGRRLLHRLVRPWSRKLT